MRPNNDGGLHGRLLVVLLAVLGFATPVGAEETDPAKLLARMSEEIAGLDRFVIHGDTYADARLPEGQIIEHAAKITVKVIRPGSMSLTNETTEGSKQIYFHDGVFTVSTQPENYYGQTELPKTLEAAVEYAIDELHVDAPLMDLLMADVADNLAQDASGLRYLGTSLIRDEVYHHLGIRGPEIDVQLWIAVDGPSLPGKIALSSKWKGGAPRFVAFLDWDTDPVVERTSFDFVPPDGAQKIEFLPEARDL